MWCLLVLFPMLNVIRQKFKKPHYSDNNAPTLCSKNAIVVNLFTVFIHANKVCINSCLPAIQPNFFTFNAHVFATK